MAMITVIDNFLNISDSNKVIEYCHNAKYSYGEYDFPGAPVTGMVHDIDETSEIYQLFHHKTRDLVPQWNLNRMYVNCFAPSENPYFHIDGSHGVTFLYYVLEEWNLEHNGETQFVIDDEIRGIFPLPNRLVYFDAKILHRATTFRTGHRFTLALKYGL